MAEAIEITAFDARQAQNALDESEQQLLREGQHEALARKLEEQKRFRVAAWILEQIWDFPEALRLYLQAGSIIDALRSALEISDPVPMQRVIEVINEVASPTVREASAKYLRHRGRHADAGKLLQSISSHLGTAASAFIQSGDRSKAAKIYAEAGEYQQALSTLGDLQNGARSTDDYELATELYWQLGDAESAAKIAQEALRQGQDSSALRRSLAHALIGLGHPLAAQMAWGDETNKLDPVQIRGKYQITGTVVAVYAGMAFAGIDRRTLQEVEIHLLLSDPREQVRPGTSLHEILEKFSSLALRANRITHPAIRTIISLDIDSAMLVLPRAEGLNLRSLIRDPGMMDAVPRAIALLAFMLDGLARAHAQGLVHGSLFPSQIVCDALGRPQLGPFGAHLLSGLSATRTTVLEEVLALTPPELRVGQSPTPMSDIYMVGGLLRSLLVGHLEVQGPELGLDCDSILQAMVHDDPEKRPSAAQVQQELKVKMADLLHLAHPLSGRLLQRSNQSSTSWAREALPAVTIEVAGNWPEELLNQLIAHGNPWIQPVLDRHGPSISLAPWPKGTKRLSRDSNWRSHLAPQALAFLPEKLRSFVESRLSPQSIAILPSGDSMIALDPLLCDSNRRPSDPNGPTANRNDSLDHQISRPRNENQ